MTFADSLLAVVVPIGIWAMVLVFMLAVLLAFNDGIQRLRRLHQVPCFRCQYYTNSPYLKCPVCPLEAGSESAIGCSDYQPADRRSPYSYPQAAAGETFLGDRSGYSSGVTSSPQSSAR